MDFSSPTQNQILKTNKISVDDILKKLRGVFDFTQTKMTENQQKQKKQTNQYRRKIFKLVEKDKVWLKLKKQFLMEWDSKKFN